MAVATKKGIVHVEMRGDKEAQHKLDSFAQSMRFLGGWRAQISSDVPYFPFVVEGTRPHTITARRPGGRLRFQGRGGVVFRRSVQHPGTRANPFVERTYNAHRHELEARAATEMERGFNAANPHAGDQAAQLAANRLAFWIKQASPVDTGRMKKSFRARFTRGG